MGIPTGTRLYPCPWVKLSSLSEDIDGMDDDAGDEEEPLPTGHWTATSSYDIYMVDTPKEGNGDETAEDDPSKKQPKRRR